MSKESKFKLFLSDLRECFRKHGFIITYTPGFSMFAHRCTHPEHWDRVIEHLENSDPVMENCIWEDSK